MLAIYDYYTSIIMGMLLDHLLNLIFPSICLTCRKGVKSGETVCHDCFASIPVNQTLFCGTCRARLPGLVKTCHKDSKFILGSASSYGNDAVKNLIHGLKFQYLRTAAAPLGELLIRYADGLHFPFGDYTIVPVPLSAERLRTRGFNQSELIAARFAERLNVPLETKTLVRTKNAKPQSETASAAERRENVRGGFQIMNADALRGKNILLIDDVITSGATLGEAASALKSAGVKKILALTVART